MTDVITAQEARDLHPEREVAVWLERIGQRIKADAQKGITSIRFPYELTEIRGEGGVAPKAGAGALIVERLKALGYRIKDHWEAAQFVDAYLTIEWGEE